MSSASRSIVAMLVALAMSISLVACGGGEAAYVGKWELDKEAFKAAVEKEMTKEEKEDPMAGMAMAMVEAMDIKLDIKSDHTFSATMSMGMLGQDETTGTWKREGNGIVMTSAEGSDGPGKLVHRGGKLYAETEKDSEEPPLVLRKQKA